MNPSLGINGNKLEKDRGLYWFQRELFSGDAYFFDGSGILDEALSFDAGVLKGPRKPIRLGAYFDVRCVNGDCLSPPSFNEDYDDEHIPRKLSGHFFNGLALSFDELGTCFMQRAYDEKGLLVGEISDGYEMLREDGLSQYYTTRLNGSRTIEIFKDGEVLSISTDIDNRIYHFEISEHFLKIGSALKKRLFHRIPISVEDFCNECFAAETYIGGKNVDKNCLQHLVKSDCFKNVRKLYLSANLQSMAATLRGNHFLVRIDR